MRGSTLRYGGQHPSPILGPRQVADSLDAGRRPARIKALLIAAFDINALYNREDHQVTIRARRTEDTPHSVAALLTDPVSTTPGTTPHHPPHPRPGPPFHSRDKPPQRTGSTTKPG